MNEKLTRLKILFSELTDTEMDQFKKFIIEFEGKQTFQKAELKESLKRSLGPIDGAKCSCCGK
jgi:DNA polymerase III sliding clamp (beta) subunit (PCNA family)